MQTDEIIGLDVRHKRMGRGRGGRRDESVSITAFVGIEHKLPFSFIWVKCESPSGGG